MACLRQLSPGLRVNTRYIKSTRGTSYNVCDVLGFVPAGLKLLNTLDLPRHKPLVMIAFFRQSTCSVISLHSAMSSSFLKGGCRTLIHASQGFPFDFFAARSLWSLTS